MKIRRSHLFTNNPHSLYWLSRVLEYISASYTKPLLFDSIKKVAEEEIPKKWERLKARGITHSSSLESYYRPDQVASTEIFIALSETIDKQSGNTAGIHLHEVGEAFELLAEAGLLVVPYEAYHRITDDTVEPLRGSKQYTIHRKLTEYLILNDLIYNYLFGFEYIIDRYTDSVVKIEVRDGDNIALGTGWLLDVPTFNSPEPFVRFVVTNDHVLTGSDSIRVLTKNDHPIVYHSKECLLSKTGHDVAILAVDYKREIPAFTLFPEPQILEEVITIGYPSVPLSRAAYQLVHRGEINAQVVDYYNKNLLIISARTAPGNSGSPVIDNAGRVIGMVTQELFEKTAFEERGITPYSACLPAATLAQAIMQADAFPQNTKELIELGLTEFPPTLDLTVRLSAFGQPKL